MSEEAVYKLTLGKSKLYCKESHVNIDYFVIYIGILCQHFDSIFIFVLETGINNEETFCKAILCRKVKEIISIFKPYAYLDSYAKKSWHFLKKYLTIIGNGLGAATKQ